MVRMLVALGVAVLAVVGLSARADAHVSKSVGNLTLSVGWREEPAYAGLPNEVDVTVLDAKGVPVVDPQADLTATVSFGDSTLVRPLLAGAPGEYRAPVVPTQPGTYAFHVSGAVRGQVVDVSATCSDATFACVTDGAEVEIPPRRAVTANRTASGPVVAEPASTDTSTATALAIVAIGLGLIALAVAVVFGLRTRRAGRPA
jgi:hypothetical protein